MCWSKGTPAPLLTGKIMDYEKKYNEALEVMRQWIAPCHTKEQLDTLKKSVFPELAENEDERIREWLVNYFKAAGKSWIHRDISPEQILAYLEKQKEPENTSASTMAPSCWAEEPSLQKVQKPAWSEDIIKKAVKEVGLTQHQINWFKTNVFPPKQEWSEEDKKMIDCIINVLASFPITITSNYNGGTSISYGGFKYQKEMDWLKSIRPSWKPSEDELTKKHLEGYIKGRNDALREMSDFMESHFNTQSGTSIKSGGNE